MKKGYGKNVNQVGNWTPLGLELRYDWFKPKIEAFNKDMLALRPQVEHIVSVGDASFFYMAASLSKTLRLKRSLLSVKEMLDYRRKRLEMEPLKWNKLSSSDHDFDSLEFRKVFCEGDFDESKSVYVGPRSRSISGVIENGFYVITPLVPKDNWAWKVEENSTAPTRVIGVVRGSEKPSIFVPENDPSSGQWFYVDVPMIARACGLPDNTLYIEDINEDVSASNPYPIPKDVNTLIRYSVMPQDHLNYTFTWYSLSAAVTYMALLRIRPNNYQASKDDIAVYGALNASPSSDYINVARWYNHIDALLKLWYASAVEDDDDDMDLFGEETEEEKKAAEERAAAVKASGKKKECKLDTFSSMHFYSYV
ncbi:hypothetical protein GW17_00035540 [Ensete ventricosum]|nr:hypothetical protein GW17_00035540 [Ensete ventricosum]